MITEKKIYQHPFFGEMYYLLQKPETITGTLPLVVFLHGAGERGYDYDKISVHGIPKMILKQGLEMNAIVVSPQCPEEYIWNNLTIFLKDFIDEIVKTYDVDPGQIVVTGLSMGGYGSWEMTMAYPGFFHKAAPVCGGGTPWRAYAITCPVWTFHGDMDSTVPIQNSYQMVDAMRAQGKNVKMTVLHGVGHNSWEEAYEGSKLIEWLLEK